MIHIRPINEDAKRRALGYLLGRFPFKSWATGEMIVPESSLAELAREGIRFNVEGPATYDQLIPSLRDSPAATV